MSQLMTWRLLWYLIVCVLLHCRLGTWQFMTDMPYVSLSQLMMWRLLWYLHQPEDESKEDRLSTDASPQDYKNYLSGKLHV